MSRFDAAASKSKAAPKPTAAAGAKAVAAPQSAGVVKKAPKLDTLDEVKKFIRAHELKIEDVEEEAKNESNNKDRKELLIKVGKFKADEWYAKAKLLKTEKELEAKIAAEKAQIAGGSPPLEEKIPSKEESAKAAAKPKPGVKVASKKPVVDEEKEEVEKEEDQLPLRARAGSENTWLAIDAGFSGTGKDAAVAKAASIKKLVDHAADTPHTLRRLDKLIDLFADGKLGAPAVKAAAAIVAAINPKGHGIAAVVVPLLLKGMEAKTWKTKAGCIDVMLPCLLQMSDETPAQLAECLPGIVGKLAEAALEVRAEIRSSTGAVLKQMGQLVQSPEITLLSADLVTALAEPTNQKHTQGVLARMGNQTFMSLLDPASVALMMPILVRGLKEREPASKKWSAQIFGSVAQLVQNVDVILPYMDKFVPLLKDALFYPVAEVQREAAKAFAILEYVLPDYSYSTLQPWLCDKIRHGAQGEQMGGSLGLAEVFVKMEKGKAEKLIAAIQTACAITEKWDLRRGFVELLDTMPLSLKMEFVPFIQRLFPPMLANINGDKDPVADPGHRASLSLVQRFGDLCPELLVPGFEGTFAATLQGDTNGECVRNQIIREKTAALLGKVVEKILDHKKFGQDMVTCEECSTRQIRVHVLCLIFIMRFDPDAAVKRISNASWKAAGGAPKVQKTVMPEITALLAKWRGGEFGPAAQKLAAEVTANLVASGDIEAPGGDLPASAKFVFPPVAGASEPAAALIVAGKNPMGETQGLASEDDDEKGWCRQASACEDIFGDHEAFKSQHADVRHHLAVVSASVCREGVKRKRAGPIIAELVTDNLKDVLVSAGHNFTDEPIPTLPAAAEVATRAILGGLFDTLGGGADKNAAEILLKVDSVLLMYGAGHLLLKDTPLEMRANQRYGVVGQNGAGKTTLMKEIATHRVVGMPKDLKCVHVDDSKLGEMTHSHLTCLEYVIKMAKDIGAHGASAETLTSVGFDTSKLQEPVSELSTGWRMRLTLAVNMLKHADLVLLDEPTNHLDEESVSWLADYIISIKRSSVMVISHEPKFLDKICTHVIAYVDKKLEYTDGNFSAFAAKRGLSQDQLDKMLSGNLSFDTKTGEEGEEGGDEVQVNAPIAGPPKLSFPIPGTMEGVKTGSKTVLFSNNMSFRWGVDKDYLISEVSVKLSLNARVAICGRNGCGKSTLMTILCSEMSPSENKDGSFGTVDRHCNLRLAYMKQDHLTSLGPFFDTSPFVYITTRFKDGYDGDLQKRLIEPEDGAEAGRRAELAKKHGKYGNEVGELLTRNKQGSTLYYEVQWLGLDDPKQNTLEKLPKLKSMGLDKVVIACDERIAAKAAGLDQRPLTRREVTRHCEAFGIDEEMCCNRQVRGFSAGQKVRLSLSAMFWTKPHLIAIDEPTNYLDVETVEALAKALTNFRGGIVMIEPKTDFVERICNEKWLLEDGKITTSKIEGGGKRQA